MQRLTAESAPRFSTLPGQSAVANYAEGTPLSKCALACPMRCLRMPRCMINHKYIHPQVQAFSKLLSTRSYIPRADSRGDRLATHQGLAALRGRFGVRSISSIHSTADPSVGLQGMEHPSDTSRILSMLPNVLNLEPQLGNARTGPFANSEHGRCPAESPHR